jgi:transcriptional regulator with XRE-family HTH domain
MSPASFPSDLTPKHVRAARALLAWSQQDLAKAANVATSTVADFERGSRTPVANNAQAIRSALESANIRFLPTGAVIGPALPSITPSNRPGAPVRWVSAQDLLDWANRTDGAVSLPTLIAHLIVATHGTAVRLRFPANEGVRHRGWDGRTDLEVGSSYVPQGVAGWEISAQRRDIVGKATEDFRKRTANPEGIEPAASTYVFVTPRHWPQKDAWAQAMKAEGAWRDVRVYDADDLVHWIEQTPAVGLWLATRLGKRPEGVLELDEVWEEWSLATQWPLTEDLVLSDRDQDAVAVLRWLRGEPAVLSLQATTSEEVVAFFHATLSELPDEMADAYRARCLVAATAAAARTLAKAPPPLYLLLTDPEPGLAKSLVERGHYVLQAYDERLIGRGEVRTLARPSREGIASALTASGIAEPRARALARDSARNLAVLRRLIPGAPGRLPMWAREPPPHALLAALLAGGWDEDAEADRARLSELADQPYEAVAAALTPYVGQFDSPLQKIGSTWRIASPSDAWVLLAQNLTAADIARFEATAHAVLGSADPRFEMDPGERWMAGLRGVRPEYSGMLRHGIGQVLILLALWGDRIHTVSEASRRADAIVAKLLDNADPQRWWSLSGGFRLLAEASPGAFMSAIEDSLDQNDPAIGVLFGHDDGGPFGTEHLSDLMWALEILAWSPDLLPRVTHLLARLDAIDVKKRRYVNGPANSLRELHLLWMPQTHATLDERLRAIDLIRKQEPDPAWKLMLGILPAGHDSSSPGMTPRWRDFSADKVEEVTWPLIGRGAAALSERLVTDVGLSAARWATLLDRLRDLSPSPAPALAALEAAEPKIVDPADRAAFWDKLRRVLNHNRQFPDVDWSLEDEVLDRLATVYARFAPDDPLERVAWLFQNGVALPDPSPEGWQGNEREVEAARQAAACELYAERGVAGVMALARLCELAGYIGKALHDAGLPADDLDAIIAAAVRSDDPRERDVAHGLIISSYHDRLTPWAAALIAKAEAGGWGDMALLTILRALPTDRWTWDQVERLGGEIETTYWRRAPVFWLSDDNAADMAYAIRRLIDVGRARHALSLVGRSAKIHLPTGLLVEVLQEAVRQPYEAANDHNEATMFQHYVTETLQMLDDRDDVDRHALIALEWNYLQLLEYSRRPAKVLLRALSEEPAFFIQMLSAVFKATEESGVVESEPEDPENARRVAHQAYRLLGLWDRIPGTRDDGTIDLEALEAWIKDARTRAKVVGRQDIADDKIGAMLSAAPAGADGVWPAEPIREVLDLYRSKPMLDGFKIGKRNRRGVTRRLPRDGGALERGEAAQYRGWAKAIAVDYPYTSKALDQIAETYEWEAARHDEDAERLDWES